MWQQFSENAAYKKFCCDILRLYYSQLHGVSGVWCLINLQCEDLHVKKVWNNETHANALKVHTVSSSGFLWWSTDKSFHSTGEIIQFFLIIVNYLFWAVLTRNPSEWFYTTLKSLNAQKDLCIIPLASTGTFQPSEQNPLLLCHVVPLDSFHTGQFSEFNDFERSWVHLTPNSLQAIILYFLDMML